jgi:NAD(P)-dependent dehydrogenase (short-subunit alcohol dehydrogenase family)
VLAAMGANLVVVGRSKRKLDQTVASVRRSTPGANVLPIVADLSSQHDVRQLAAEVLREVPRLHALINNAAVVTMRREETVDGIERQLAVNHLAPFLLTNLLIDRLADSAPSRVVMVASQVERGATIDLDDLQRRQNYDGKRAYSQSKLANILFAGELARRVEGRGISVISLHPGVYTTRLIHDLLGWSPIMTKLRGRSLPGPEGGALVIARAAAAPELAVQGTIHLHEHEVSEPSAQARDEALAAALWTASARLTAMGA